MSDSDLIWYASYGSNCLSERFHAYLTGGRAPGTTSNETGARDTSLPLATAPMWFPSPVQFAGTSSKWGPGGVAFLDHASKGRSRGRRYLITKGQFDDLTAQENRRKIGRLPIHLVQSGGIHVFAKSVYGALLALPPVEDVPVVTFTFPTPVIPLRLNAPSAEYLGTILRGLSEVHDEQIAKLAEELFRYPGIGKAWTPESIAALA